jgi:hypothetical protein
MPGKERRWGYWGQLDKWPWHRHGPRPPSLDMIMWMCMCLWLVQEQLHGSVYCTGSVAITGIASPREEGNSHLKPDYSVAP